MRSVFSMLVDLTVAIFSPEKKSTPKPDTAQRVTKPTARGNFWSSSVGFVLIGLVISIVSYVLLVTETSTRSAGKHLFAILIGLIITLLGFIRIIIEAFRKTPSKKSQKRTHYSK